ncbi:MAG: histidinol-phosphate transaminase [Candidatus Bathyarchaeota archaeon]|nr:histidinol-phosphate transaminase [Candidatus Bathyarchaeota archaeon]
MKTRDRSWLKQILKEAQNLSIYDVGETIEGLVGRLGRDPSEILKLNSNENFFVPKELLRNLLDEVNREIDPRIYPRDEKTELKEALSKYVKVSPDQIIIGTGSDQLIDLISRAFLKRGDLTLTVTPTFSMYERCVRTMGADLISVPLRKDFSLDVENVLKKGSDAKLLFLCSPNNPTANQFEIEKIRRLIDQFDGLVVVDEAYAEFAEKAIIPLVDEFENLVVLRTFSKAFGVAGLRLGYGVSSGDLASTISQRFQMPYVATLIALKMGVKLLERIDAFRDAIVKLKAEREVMIKRLNGMEGVNAFDSQTNFVLVELERSSAEVYRTLLNRGIIVRDLGRILHLENCLRVTVAPPEMTDRFITEFGGVLNERDG